jgi:ABC-type multidrug transport system ATPase subunit
MTLSVRALHKRLGGRPVLAGVGFELGGGEALAILGANGSGKTTLLRACAGVLEPDEGSITLRGVPLRRARRHLGYVPESADPPPHLTPAELLRLCAALRRAPPLAAATVERLGVTPFLDQRIGSLSLGQRRRACLAAALVGEPWLLILDEPSNGLDPGGVTLLGDVLAEHTAAGRALLFATHDLALTERLAARRKSL